MNSTRLCLATALIAAAFALPSAANAQAYRGYSSGVNGPTVSPYLNLLQRNQFGLPAYQSLVRPEFEARNAIAQQELNLQQLQQRVNNSVSEPSRRIQGSGTNVRRTGHPTYYSEYSHYYNSNTLRRSITPFR